MKLKIIIVLIKEMVKRITIILFMKNGLMQLFVNLGEMLGEIIFVYVMMLIIIHLYLKGKKIPQEKAKIFRESNYEEVKDKLPDAWSPAIFHDVDEQDYFKYVGGT